MGDLGELKETEERLTHGGGRTSTSQFRTMVAFMEAHGGDLMRANIKAASVDRTRQHWRQLTRLLNADRSGIVKTVERWKKVWSDLKNNTKKKLRRERARPRDPAAPLPPPFSALERRVLRITEDSWSLQQQRQSRQYPLPLAPALDADADAEEEEEQEEECPTSVPEPVAGAGAEGETQEISIAFYSEDDRDPFQAPASPVEYKPDLASVEGSVPAPALEPTPREPAPGSPSCVPAPPPVPCDADAARRPAKAGHTSTRGDSHTSRVAVRGPWRRRFGVNAGDARWRRLLVAQTARLVAVQRDQLRQRARELQSQARWRRFAREALSLLRELQDRNKSNSSVPGDEPASNQGGEALDQGGETTDQGGEDPRQDAYEMVFLEQDDNC